MSRSTTTRLVLVLVSALLATACGGGDDDDGNDGGGAVADADPNAPDAPPNQIIDASMVDVDAPFNPGPDAAPPPCNLLSNTAGTAPVNLIIGSAPAANGGTIQAGTYHVTKQEIFTSQGNPGQVGEVQWTWAFAASSVDNIYSMNGGDDVPAHADYTTGGNTITISQTCPTVNELGWDVYDVNGSTLALHNVTMQSTIVVTMVRQ